MTSIEKFLAPTASKKDNCVCLYLGTYYEDDMFPKQAQNSEIALWAAHGFRKTSKIPLQNNAYLLSKRIAIIVEIKKFEIVWKIS